MGHLQRHAELEVYRTQRSRGVLPVALSISLALHLAAGVWWSSRPDQAVRNSAADPIELILEPSIPSKAPEPEEQETPEPQIAAEEPAVIPEPSAETEDLEPPLSAEEQLAEAEPTDSPAEISPPPLKLNRPSDWSRYFDQKDTLAINELPFNRDIAELKSQAEAGKARRELLAMRERAVYGLSDEEFGIREGFGNRMIKIDGRCYILREAEELGGGTQWSITGCPDPRQHPMTLPLLEFDAIGRVVAD